jgi:hypothetical protein
MSTGGRLTVGQLVPRGTPRQQEEHIEPQQEGSAEPQLEEDAIHSQGDNNHLSDYTTLSDLDDLDLEPELVRAAIEFHSYGEESPTVPVRLHGFCFS